MSPIVQSATLAGTSFSLSRSEQRNTMDPSGERLSFAESNLGRHETDTFDSASTSDSEKWNKSSDASTVELQFSTDAATPATGVADEKACSTHERAHPGRWQRFCLDWLTAYRVLISGVIMTNLGALVAQMIVNPTVEAPLTATAANIMVAVLLRQEGVINVSFRLISKLPATLPLPVRKTIGDLHHYGGAHIGCALSALLWYCVFVGLNTVRVLKLLNLGDMTTTLYVDIATAYAALLAIIVLCATAIPRFRIRFHNTFEATHRFGGWATLVVLWVHAGIVTLTPDTSTPLYAYPSMWLLAVTTLLIILPWLRIRRVPITAYPISEREVELTFPYTSMPYTSTIRTSTAPLTEWHAFATIPVSSTTCKIIIAQAGDWTKSIISSPPEKLWIRNPPTLNFLTFAPLFKSLLLVATGAGIAPMLSLLASLTLSRMRSSGQKVTIMWCAYHPSAPHWAFVLDAIRKVDGFAKVFDSSVGRPDVAFEARRMAERKGVEAVMVVSNPVVTKGVVDECKMAGLAAYGAVFDS